MHSEWKWHDRMAAMTNTYSICNSSLKSGIHLPYTTQRQSRLERISREEDEENKRGTKKPPDKSKRRRWSRLGGKNKCSLKTSWQADVNVTRVHKQPLQCILILNPSALLNHACAWRLMNIYDATKAKETGRPDVHKRDPLTRGYM